MKKVVILSVPRIDLIPPVAPALISACLENAGVSSAGLDFNESFSNHFYDKPYWVALKLFLSVGSIDNSISYRRATIDLLKFIKQYLLKIKEEFNPEIIGLSIFTEESIKCSYFMSYSIRKYLPDVKIMVGGRGLELNCGIENKPHYQKYHDYGLADLIIVGDAEISVVEAIKDNKTGIVMSAPQTKDDLDNIPVPNWKYYNFEYYRDYDSRGNENQNDNHYLVDPRAVYITGSKGCVRNCSFCDVNEYWPTYIFRKGENIARDIINAYRDTGRKSFFFTDNLMNGSITNYRRMNQILADTIPNTITYSGYAIFRDKQSMPAEDFELAGKAGCIRWAVGIESGSESVRKDMRKNFSNDDMYHGIEQLYKNKILQQWLMIVGYPSETEEDFNMSLDLLKKYQHLASSKLIELTVSLPFQLNTIVPLTREQQYVQKYSWNQESITQPDNRFFWTTTNNPDNTFPARYDRFYRFVDQINKSGYPLNRAMDIKKYYIELDNLKKLYDQTRKKIIYINKV